MHILLVCSGNTCRSPLAAALFQHKLAKSEIEVRSAGTYATDGDSVSKQVSSVLQERGIQLAHVSRRVNTELMEWADLVLTMTRATKFVLMTRFGKQTSTIATLKEFVGDRHQPDIEDPYGSSFERYRQLAEELDTILDQLHQKLQEQRADVNA